MLIIGHRGAAGLAPENTLKALQKGLEHHVDELELDVRVTKDGQVILQHDPEVKTPDGRKVVVASATYQELRKHKSDLATLEQAFDLVDRRVPLYIEVKPGVATRPVVDLVRGQFKKGWRNEDFRLGSYSQRVLLELHEALPDIEKIVIEDWSSWRARRRAREVGTDRIAMYNPFMWSGFVRAISRHYRLGIYPLNNPKRARRWEKYGLHAVITDLPDLFDDAK